MDDISLYLLSIIQNSSFSQNQLKKIRSYQDQDRLLSFLKSQENFNLREGEIELGKVNSYGAKLVSFLDKGYPQILKEIYDYPVLLYYMGEYKIIERPAIAIVGARDSSISGRDFAAKVANYAANLGFAIVSGLAGGIDKAAHEGAGASNTIAVIGNGLDVHYPKSNNYLYNDIKRHGLILSEYKLGSKPFAYCFPRRNRIIAGLVKLLIVIEAREKSGSLITCRFALEHNREILAIPGFPADSRSLGGNKLIAEGAHIFTDFEAFKDLLQEVYQFSISEFNNKNSCEKNIASIDGHADQIFGLKDKILNLLTTLPQTQDEIISHLTEYNLVTIVEALTELRLEGKVLRDEQSEYRCKGIK